MIICTKCATENDDAATVCERCGHKLRSDRPSAPSSDEPDASAGLLPEELPALSRRSVSKYIESWLYVLVLLGAAIFAVVTGIVWPVPAAVGFVFLVILLRRI